MSDLAAKFSDLEIQIGNNHTAISNALTAIIDALGGVPPTTTTTLADIATLLGSLGTDLDTVLTDNSTYYAASLDVLGLINTNLDTMVSNNSLNTQRLLAALYATFCDCATETPLISAPLDVTTTSLVDEAKCRRIQFYLSVFGEWLNQIANYGSSGAAVTGGTLAVLLQSVVTSAGIVATGVEVGAAGGPPGIVIGAVVALITIAVYTFGGSYLIDIANQFNDPTLRDNMVQAMFAATNADEGYTAFKTTLLASISGAAGEVIYTLWWSAWSNDV